jgi:hypothetical protein
LQTGTHACVTPTHATQATHKIKLVDSQTGRPLDDSSDSGGSEQGATSAPSGGKKGGGKQQGVLVGKK